MFSSHAELLAEILSISGVHLNCFFYEDFYFANHPSTPFLKGIISYEYSAVFIPIAFYLWLASDPYYKCVFFSSWIYACWTVGSRII